jgi:adenosylhomocysteine nucleosidase
MVKLLTLILVLSLGSSAASSHPSGFGPRTFEAPPFTALVTAYRPEIDALTAYLRESPHGEITDEIVFRGVRYFLGTYRGEPVLLFATGMSLTNAAMSMQMAIDYFPVSRVVLAGIAGAINDQLDKGDVVIPERWAYHDEAAYFNPDGEGGWILADYYAEGSFFNSANRPANDPHFPNYENFGMIFPDVVLVVKDGMETPTRMPYFTADPELLAASQRAVEVLTRTDPFWKTGERKVRVGGTGVTGTVFVDNAEYRQWLYRVWRAEVTEMETAAIAHVCFVNEIPWIMVRSVSDLAGGQEGKNEENLYDDYASENATRVLFAILDQIIAP